MFLFKILAAQSPGIDYMSFIDKKLVKRLGGESAFAVSAEAKEWASTHPGQKVAPFHVGDIKGIGPSKNFLEGVSSSPNNYPHPQGLLELRNVLAKKLSSERGLETPWTAENISIQPGGKPGLFKIIMSFVKPGDKVLVPEPGYPIYESITNLKEGKITRYGFETNGKALPKLDIDTIISEIETGNIKMLVLNDDSNPGGLTFSEEDKQRIATACKTHQTLILSDEPYFNTRFTKTPGSSIAKLLPELTLVCWTYSKEGAATGHRIGCVAGPVSFIDIITKWNGNIESGTNHTAQSGLLNALQHPDEEKAHLNVNMAILKARKDLLLPKLNEMGFECHDPQAGFYLYPCADHVMAKTGFTDVEEFRKAILNDTGVSFCTDTHFGVQQETKEHHHIRFAFSGIELEDIEPAMAKLSNWIDQKTA